VDDTLHVALSVVRDSSRILTRLVNLRRVGDRFVSEDFLDVDSEGEISVEDDANLLIGPTGLTTMVWDSNPSGIGDQGDVMERTLSRNNNPVSAVVQIDEGLMMRRQGAALLSEGRAIVAWRATEGPCNMLGRFVNVPQLLFADGFESGDTSACHSALE